MHIGFYFVSFYSIYNIFNIYNFSGIHKNIGQSYRVPTKSTVLLGNFNSSENFF